MVSYYHLYPCCANSNRKRGPHNRLRVSVRTCRKYVPQGPGTYHPKTSPVLGGLPDHIVSSGYDAAVGAYACFRVYYHIFADGG